MENKYQQISLWQRLFALPNYLIIKLIIKYALPSSHYLKQEVITLPRWVKDRPVFIILYDVATWVWIINVFLFVLITQ